MPVKIEIDLSTVATSLLISASEQLLVNTSPYALIVGIALLVAITSQPKE
jgi:hypothetical protein